MQMDGSPGPAGANWESTEFLIDSAGTAAYHVGEKPDPRSIEVARKNNIDITDQRARKFQVSDFDSFDYILVMDESNYNDVIGLANSEEDRLKVSRILDWDDSAEVQNVPDPYYGGNQGFDFVFQLLDKACNLIVRELRN